MFLRAIFWQLLHLWLCNMHRHIYTDTVADGPQVRERGKVLGLFLVPWEKLITLNQNLRLGLCIYLPELRLWRPCSVPDTTAYGWHLVILEMSELRAQHLIPGGWFLSPDINTRTLRSSWTSLPIQWLTGYGCFIIWWHEHIFNFKRLILR